MWRVPEPKPRRKLVALIAAALVALGAGVAFVPVERTLTCVCQVDAVERWTFRELRPGTYESRAIDNISGRTTFYRLYQFDRPTFLEFHAARPPAGRPAESGAPAAAAVSACAAGEVVGRLSSSSLNVELNQRLSDLKNAQAYLAALKGGAKPETVDMARVAVQQARAALVAHEPSYERDRDLYAADLISASVWEETAGRRDLLELGLRLAEAELHVVETGARPEDIAAAEVAVAACERELAVIQALVTDQDVRVPITGELRPDSSSGGLIGAVRLDTVMVCMLVAQSSGHLPRAGQRFDVHLPGTTPGPRRGSVVRVDHRILDTEAGPFLTVFGVLANGEGRLVEGMEGHARVRCGRTTLLDRLWDGLRRAWRREVLVL